MAITVTWKNGTQTRSMTATARRQVKATLSTLTEIATACPDLSERADNQKSSLAALILDFASPPKPTKGSE